MSAGYARCGPWHPPGVFRFLYTWRPMLMRILLGVLIAVAGYMMVWKTEWFYNFFGPVPWAEHNLGGGGTRLFYKLLGTAIILLGFVVITDLYDAFMTSLVGAIFG